MESAIFVKGADRARSAVDREAQTANRVSLARWVVSGVAGFAAIGVLSHGTDVALRVTGLLPVFDAHVADEWFALAVVYRSVIGALGCYLAARLASTRPMSSALALGGVGFGLSALGVLANWQRPELGPLWYPIVLALLTLPAAWLGGSLAARGEPARN